MVPYRGITSLAHILDDPAGLRCDLRVDVAWRAGEQLSARLDSLDDAH